MEAGADTAKYRIDAGAWSVEIDVGPTFGVKEGAARVEPKLDRSELHKVVVHPSRAAKWIDRIGSRKGLVRRVREKRHRRRYDIAETVDREFAINADLRMSGDGAGYGNGGK